MNDNQLECVHSSVFANLDRLQVIRLHCNRFKERLELSLGNSVFFISLKDKWYENNIDHIIEIVIICAIYAKI